MKTGTLRKLLTLVMLIALTSVFACSAGRDVYEVSSLTVDSVSNLIFPDDKPILKKKVLIAPVINKAGFSDAQAEEIRQDCISYLSKDDSLVLTKLINWGDKEPGSLSRTYGSVINPEYAKTAEEKGMNVLLACIVHPLEITEKRTGIWPNRKDGYNVLISVSVNALDAVNGTLIVFENKTEEMKFKKSDTGQSNKWTPDYSMIKGEISSSVKKLCSSVIERLRRQYWQSKVIVDSGNLNINAGRSIGITENTVFEIFKKGHYRPLFRPSCF